MCDRPDDFVLDRFQKPDAPRLLTFGTGSHYGLGANLARMTLVEAVRGLVENPGNPPSISPRSHGECSLGEAPCPCLLHCAERLTRQTAGPRRLELAARGGGSGPSSWNSSSRPVEARVVVGPGSRLGWEDVTADLFEDFRR